MHFTSTISALGWVLSLGIHAGVATWLLDAKTETRRPPPPSLVSFTVSDKPRAATPLPPPPPRPTVEAPIRAAARAGRPPAELPPKEPSVKPVAAPTPVDLTGVTLTGGDGAAWSSITGNGQSMGAPIRPTVTAPPKPHANPSPSDAVGAKPAVPVVALRDLAAKPSPPRLNSQLLANYPPAARRQGLAGTAKVLARVESDGVIRQAQTLSESSAGFGAACKRTLIGSKWSPPRDRSGRAVVTEIHYTCDFRVEGS